MVNSSFRYLILFLITAHAQAKSFDIKVGDKKLQIELADVEISQFCENSKLGCVRVTPIKKEASFGFIKILNNKMAVTLFSTYCQETYKGLLKMSPDLKNFNEGKDQNTHFCSWSDDKDLTTIIWRDGITIMLTSNNPSLDKKINTQIRKANIL